MFIVYDSTDNNDNTNIRLQAHNNLKDGQYLLETIKSHNRFVRLESWKRKKSESRYAATKNGKVAFFKYKRDYNKVTNVGWKLLKSK